MRCDRSSALVLLLLAALAVVHATSLVSLCNNVALSTIRANNTAPPVAARALAMVHLAMHDVINTGTPVYNRYTRVTPPAACTTTSASCCASREYHLSAMITAAHDVLVALFPVQRLTVIEPALTAAQSGVWTSLSQNDACHSVADACRSVADAFGASVALAVLASRAGDGSTQAVAYNSDSTEVGVWRRTPPAFAPAALPQWGNVKPFVLSTGSQFRPPPPPALNTADYASDFNTLKGLGCDVSPVRTADETVVAYFWADGPGTCTPPGHWNMIAQEVFAVRHPQETSTSVHDEARLFALLNSALADAGIAAWDTKYTYNQWRPVTAIRLADTDGNDATQPDTTWTPLLPTPAFPDYVSGHSTFSGAASRLLELWCGTDAVTFSCGSDALRNVTRTFNTLSAAAEEAGMSRLCGGIHWPTSNVQGLSLGRSVGTYVFSSFLLVLNPQCGA